MRTVILIILSLLLVFTRANAQDTDTISVEQAKVKTKTFFDELFMFRMAADVLETRALISDNELGDSVENYMTNYDNALFFISRLEYDFFWNNLLGRKKYKVPSSKLFLDSKDSYISKSEPGSSIDFDIVLTPQWVDPATEEKLKDYKVQINTANYTNLALTSEEKENLNTILNSPFTKNYGTPKDAEVNEAVFKGLAELRRLLAEAQKPVEIGLQLDFKPYESQQFGFDKLSYDVHKPSYIIRTYNGKEMYLPWKSISSSGIDQVLVEVADADNNYSPGDVKFKTSTGTTVSATPFEGKDKLFLVNVTGKTNEEVEEIQAYVNYEIDEETQKEVVIGGLNTISYDKQSISLVIVPVNVAAPFSADQFTTKLNEIYKQSVVEWKVTLDDVFEISESEWDQDGDHKMNDGESTFLSDYSDEQLALKRKYKQERDIDKQAYYVFLLNNIPSKSGLEGYMPLKKQYAYIHSATSENAAQLIAHELGHGAFRLWHTFSTNSDYFMAQKSSDNLMDYNKGTRLHKYQWDKVHNPDGGFYMFQDEDEAAYYDNCTAGKPTEQGSSEGEYKQTQGTIPLPETGSSPCFKEWYYHIAEEPYEACCDENGELEMVDPEYATGWYKAEKFAEINRHIIIALGILSGDIHCLHNERSIESAEYTIEEFFGSKSVSASFMQAIRDDYEEVCSDYKLRCSGSGMITPTYLEFDIALELTAIGIAKDIIHLLRINRIAKLGARKLVFQGSKLMDDAGEVIARYSDDALRELKFIDEGGEVIGISDNVVRYADENGKLVEEELALIKKDGKLGFRRVQNSIDGSFTTLIDDKVEIIARNENLPDWIKQSFRNGNYNTVLTKEEIIVYRDFGDKAFMDGSFSTTVSNATRNDLALHPSFNNNMRFKAKIEVPVDETLNIGKVGPYPPGDPNALPGGADQVLLPENYSHNWIKNITDTQTGVTYTVEEFKNLFPELIKNK